MINQNGEITKQLKESFGLSELTGYPRRISEAILPVVEINTQKITKVTRGSSTTTGNITIATTPKDKDFYLYGIQAAYCKNAACDTASGVSYTISATPFGTTTQSLITFPIITLTAQQDNIWLTLEKPILLERGTSILFNGSFGAGECVRTATVYGIEVINTGN